MAKYPEMGLSWSCVLIFSLGEPIISGQLVKLGTPHVI